jgi:hypothetical protein
MTGLSCLCWLLVENSWLEFSIPVRQRNGAAVEAWIPLALEVLAPLAPKVQRPLIRCRDVWDVIPLAKIPMYPSSQEIRDSEPGAQWMLLSVPRVFASAGPLQPAEGT